MAIDLTSSSMSNDTIHIHILASNLNENRKIPETFFRKFPFKLPNNCKINVHRRRIDNGRQTDVK